MPEKTERKNRSCNEKTREFKQIRHIRRGRRKGAHWTKPSRGGRTHCRCVQSRGQTGGKRRSKARVAYNGLYSCAGKPGTALSRRDGGMKRETISE